MQGRNKAAGYVLSAILLTAMIWPAHAAYPDKAIRIICAYAPGSGSDILIRYFARKLEPLAGQPVIVENRPGANGAVGTLAAAAARPDGHTVFIISTSTLAANPLTSSEIKYVAERDFMPVSPLFLIGSVIAVSAKSDVHNLKELTESLRRKGKDANYSITTTTAIGVTALYFEREKLKDAVRVNYKSNPDAATELAAGNLDFSVLDVTLGVCRANAGQLRLVAATTADRAISAPSLPTVKEQGYDDLVFESNWSAFLPAGAPEEARDKLNRWFNEILALPETKEFLAPNGAQVLPGDPAKLAAILKDDIAMWNRVAKLVNLKQD